MTDAIDTIPADVHVDMPVAGGDRARCFAGIDEAGRGPLAGPVVVAAVVFEPGRTPINGLADSKQLCPERREVLYARIIERALAWRVVFVEVDDIDRINIFHATMLGMRLAMEGVLHVAAAARIDGNALPRDLPCPGEAIIGGDASDRSIMAASILAKVSRDRFMKRVAALHPHWDFASHVGYSTPEHRAAIEEHGVSPLHRLSFQSLAYQQLAL